MSSPLKNNTTSLQDLLDAVNALPEAGVDLPELSNEASASDLLSGKQLINSNGSKVTGTFSIDSELNTQDSLISQIQTALQNKSSVTLPTLSNPATAENLEEGYELIDGNGNIVVGTHVCEGGSGGGSGSPTFSVVNNLNHPLIVNGVGCPVGETTNNIPYGDGMAPYFILFEDENDFSMNYEVYLSDYGNGNTSAWFYATSDDFIYDYGYETESCGPNLAASSNWGFGYRNLCGILLTLPWDYVNETFVDGATITFSF